MRRKRFIWVLIILAAAFFLIRGWWSLQLSAVSSDGKVVDFIIEKGESFTSVSKRLNKQDLIKSSYIFSIYARQKDLVDKIQPGSFKLSSSMTSEEILKEITGQPEDLWVTLVEGWRVEEMAEELSSKFQVPSSKFLEVAKEGYMFPDTYLFPKEYTAEQIAKKLRDTFDAKYSNDLRAKIKSLGLTEDEGVILASIVEREARSDKARTEIASILLKRLKIGMGLNADATLQYILGYQPDEKSWWTKHLTGEHKKINSPYNTYFYKGLPPKSIANPSFSSLEAVANADSSTPYLYYYHDSKGNSFYAKTLEEHNQNVANNP